MKTHAISVFAAAILFTSPAFCEESPGKEADSTALMVKRLIADLGNPDFSVREKATEELIRIGVPAIEEVRKARSSADLEVKARAERIVAAIEKASKAAGQSGPAGERPGAAGDTGRQTIRKLIDDMMKQLEKRGDRGDEGEKDDLDDLFGDLDDLFGPRRDGRPGGADDWNEFWKRWRERSAKLFPDIDELRRWREKVEKELEEARKQGGERRSPWQSMSVGQGRLVFSYSNGRESVEYTREADGSLRLKVTGPDGEKVFAAASEEEFRKKHPDVLDKYVGSRMPGRMRIRINGPESGAGRPPKAGDFGLSESRISEILQSHLGLSAGQGFLATSVEEGSQAAAWGLRQYDIVLAVDGKPVSSLADFRAVLAQIAPGSAMSVEIIRRAARTALRSVR